MAEQSRSVIVSYGAYVPYHRLTRSAIAQGTRAAAGHGARTVASFDEDTTSLGVEAGRQALGRAPEGYLADGLLFATTAPAYLDKTNGTAIHAALGLDRSAVAVDVVGSARNGATALRLASEHPGRQLVVASDIRVGLTASLDEREGGDAAAAIAFGPGGEGDALARVLASGTATEEFLERWRTPERRASQLWEERFGDHAYAPLVEDAVADALKAAGLVTDAIDHLIVVGPHSRAVRAAARAVGAPADALADDLMQTVGNAGAAHAALVLVSVLDVAGPDEVIALVSVADGADVLLLRTTELLPAFRARHAGSVAEQVASGNDTLEYNTYLTWRGLLDRQPPRRPDPRPPAPPPALRSVAWKFGFVGSRCQACGNRHLPPQRVCVSCGTVDQMAPEPMADVPGTVATFTLDQLTHSVNPPVVAAVIDFDGGGRFKCELTDVDPDRVAIGDRVAMTFRRLHTADGIHNYAWKARPVRAGAATPEA